MSTVVYVFWVMIPLSFLTVVVFSHVSSVSKKQKNKHTSHLIGQTLFLTAVSVLCFVTDSFFLGFLVETVLFDFVSRDVAVVLLYPLYLVLGASFLGGSKPILLGEKNSR